MRYRAEAGRGPHDSPVCSGLREKPSRAPACRDLPGDRRRNRCATRRKIRDHFPEPPIAGIMLMAIMPMLFGCVFSHFERQRKCTEPAAPFQQLGKALRNGNQQIRLLNDEGNPRKPGTRSEILRCMPRRMISRSKIRWPVPEDAYAGKSLIAVAGQRDGTLRPGSEGLHMDALESPSIGNICPEMDRAWGPARKRASAAISSGSTNFFTD